MLKRLIRKIWYHPRILKWRNEQAPKYFRWCVDKDGDFGLKIGPLVFVFYKWSDPTIMWAKNAKLDLLNDANSKTFYRAVQNAMLEAYDYLEEDDEECEGKHPMYTVKE